MHVDDAFKVAGKLLDDAIGRIGAIVTEEDTKLQIIMRIVIEVLGWDHQDISAERRNENGYSDYVVGELDRPSFLIEAKRIGEIKLGTKSSSKGYFKISGPVLRSAQEGISQAASYCQPEGIQLAVLTDGIVWIIFLPWVKQANYVERQAIVFPSLQSVLDDFALFFELLSKTDSQKATFQVIFDSIHENRLVLDRELRSPIFASENVIVQKHSLSFDLESVYESFFSSLAGDKDPELLVECFVETRESRIADFALERLTKNVLGNIDPNERDVEEGLQAVVQNAVAGELSQTVFIVGPSGAGKSTFLTRFFQRTLPLETRAKCVVLHIDALDASGDEAAALPWVTERAISLIESQLFEGGSPTWNHLQALYHLEYLRRSKGADALLYARDKEAFREKFALFVDGQVESDREGYLRKLMADIVKNRKKLPVFIIDNTDEFSLSFKTSLFQYFQALRREVNQCLLLFPATDRSAWAFSKTEIFNIYSSKSFFLPTPPPREVFRRRIEYVRSKANAQEPDVGAEYIAHRGIRVNVKNLSAFLSILENLFVNEDYAARRIGELSNYNMRKALGLAKRVVTSSVLHLEDLVRSYLTGDMVAPTQVQFMNALVKGDYTFFKVGDEPLLFPLFQVDSTVRQSPLIHCRVLILLDNLSRRASEDSERYMTVSSISAYFGVMAVSEAAIHRSLENLLTAGLIEQYDLSKRDYSEDQRFSITYSGMAHLEIGLFNSVVFEQLSLTTRITDLDMASQIRGAFNAKDSFSARLERVRELFATYLCDEDGRHCHVPDRPEFRGQALLTEELRGRWVSAKPVGEEAWESPDLVAEAARGNVRNFDHQRGFGFVDVPSLGESAFLHARVVEQGDFPDLFEGDEVVCDITTNSRGFVVSRLHSISPGQCIEAEGTVVKVFPERHYGFLHVPTVGADAFFHYNLFSAEQQRELREGQTFFAEVRTDSTGKAQVRRIVP
jgi:cold shock CspA family protein